MNAHLEARSGEPSTGDLYLEYMRQQDERDARWAEWDRKNAETEAQMQLAHFILQSQARRLGDLLLVAMNPNIDDKAFAEIAAVITGEAQ
jgi:hypothetical protein